MLRAIALLLSCQMIGEAAARGLSLPLPGPVIGLALLALGLGLASRFGGPSPDEIDATALGRVAAGLLGSLGLLFVPAGVGIIQHMAVMHEHGAALLVALVGSTAITLAVTVAVYAIVARSIARGGKVQP